MTLFTGEGKPLGKSFVKTVGHRGHADAPENTLPAFKMAKKMGFDYVECDVAVTADGVFVLLHDATIDRTSNGTGNIANMTLEQVRAYDFGSWKSAEYAGTKIPTFEEFLLLCRNIGLHPYIEIKDSTVLTTEQTHDLVDMVASYGLKGKETWVSATLGNLEVIKAYDPTARLCYVKGAINADIIGYVNGLKTDSNEVFISLMHTNSTDAYVELAQEANIPVEYWGFNETESDILAINPYITGLTCDKIHAGKVLFDNAME